MDETQNAAAITTSTPAVAPEPKKDAVENLVIETYEPKKSCRKCHGRGIIGLIEGDPNKPYYCNCIMKVKKELTPAQSAAYSKAMKPSVIVQDNSNGPTGPQGPGPCPQGLPGVEGVAGETQTNV